jgi:hypothetical protein
MADNRARIWFSLFVLAVFCVGGAAGFVIGRHAPPFGGPPGRVTAARRSGSPAFFVPGAGRRGGPRHSGDSCALRRLLRTSSLGYYLRCTSTWANKML